MSGTLVFRNQIQVALWNKEICGQISDGAWENEDPIDHWKAWADADAVTGTQENLGRDFDVKKDDYDLLDLIELLSERMLGYASDVAGYRFEPYDLWLELSDMEETMKIRRDDGRQVYC